MNNFFYRLANFFNITLLSIFIGIISSVMINVLTTFNFEKYSLGIMLSNLIALICIIRLVLLRQEYEVKLQSRSSVGESVILKWENSVGEHKKWNFISTFTLCVLSFLTGLVFIYFENQSLKDQADLKKNQLEKIVQQDKIITNLRADSFKTVSIISLLQDSISDLKSHPEKKNTIK